MCSFLAGRKIIWALLPKVTLHNDTFFTQVPHILQGRLFSTKARQWGRRSGLDPGRATNRYLNRSVAACLDSQHDRYMLSSIEKCRTVRGISIAKLRTVAELRSVFCDIYRFDTEEWKIPSNRSHNSLAFKLMGFLEEYDSKDSLLIVYYGGHGGMNDDRQCVWSW